MNRDSDGAYADWQQLGIRLPAALSGRLDGLLAIADDAGVRTSRRELVAALLYDGFQRESELGELVTGYRRSPVTRAFLAGEDRLRFQEPIRTPGPRRSAVASSRASDGVARAGQEEPEDQRLARSRTVRIGLALPPDLHDELGRIVARMEEERATRTEVIAALVLASPEAEGELAEVVRCFRRADLPARPRRKARGSTRLDSSEASRPPGRGSSARRQKRSRR